MAGRRDPPPPGRTGGAQQTNVSGANNFIVQIRGNGNKVVAGCAHLTLTRYLNRRLAADETRGEAALLSPYSLAVPLVGREATLADLWGWLKGSRPISVRVVTARAGTGKTRLALELCDQALGAGWGAGFLTECELVRFRDQQNLSTWGWNRPTLVVVDYAGMRARLLHDWLIELADHKGHEGKPLRLLLLERHADPAGGWWREAFGLGGGDAEAIGRLLDPPFGLYPLPSLAGAEERRMVLASILDRVGSGLQLPEPGQSADFEHRLAEISWGGEPLFLLMAGLVAGRASFAEVLALSAPELGRHIALREIQRLHEIAKTRSLPGSFLAHLAAYITLCQGLTRGEVEEVIEEEKGALHYDAVGNAAEVANALAMALSGEPGAVSPILPDVVGEAVALEALGAGEGEGGGEKALLTVVRAAHRAPERVTASLIHLAQDYGAVRSEPLKWFARLAEETVDLRALVALLVQLPVSTLVLRESAANLTFRVVEIARSQNARGTLALVLNYLSKRLNDLGRREDALTACHEATQLYRELAVARPDTIRPFLASALNSLSNCLSNLGRREDALTASYEAAQLYRELAAARPDAFRPDLASTLNNLSNRLGDLGRREDALTASYEAAQLYRELPAARFDGFRPDLAMALNNLSHHLSDLGRSEDALNACDEAAQLYRELTAARPDTFRPELAGTLNNLSVYLGDLDRCTEALIACQEAVQIYRELATARPDAFGPELAMALTNLSKCLSVLSRREDALTACQEAAQLYRGLAAARPDVFSPDLATALHNLSNRLSDLGQREEAFAVSEEAVRTLAPHFLALPSAFRRKMEIMVRAYLKRAEGAEQAPDMELLAPVWGVLEASPP